MSYLQKEELIIMLRLHLDKQELSKKEKEEQLHNNGSSET